MAADDTPRFTWFERNAWAVLAAVDLVFILFGVGDIFAGGSTFESGEVVLFNRLTGTTWAELQATDPAAANLIDYQVRIGGALLAISGILTLAICLTAFRRGERWAWLAMWVWPFGIAATSVLIASAIREPGVGVPVPIISGAITIVIWVATLALSARRYLRADDQASIGNRGL